MSNVEPFQSKLDKICLRDSWLSCGLSCSSFCKVINSWSMCFCIGVHWASFPGFWGVISQNILLVSSDLGICNDALTYWMALSWFVSERWSNGAGLTGLINFACSGVKIEKVATWHTFFVVYGSSKMVLMSTAFFLFWVVVNAGQL